MKTPQERFKELLEDPVFFEWYNARPLNVKLLIQRYPFTRYRVRENAPYAITCPGSVVHLQAYSENGMVRVILFAKDKLPAAIEHEMYLAETHGGTPATTKNIVTHIDPQYLEPFEDETTKA